MVRGCRAAARGARVRAAHGGRARHARQLQETAIDWRAEVYSEGDTTLSRRPSPRSIAPAQDKVAREKAVPAFRGSAAGDCSRQFVADLFQGYR